jgi:cyclophilin family peptidyl-prolyl cis-trans isomerase/protein-disulfide isomerase
MISSLNAVTEPSLYPPVSANDWTLGPETAAMTIIEYGDYQDPYCAQLAPILEQLSADYPADLRLVYRHFPQASIHDKALLAVQAAQAAGIHGRFWQMNALLFARQVEWVVLSTDKFQDWLVSQATGLDLEPKQFVSDLTSQENTVFAEQTWKDGLQLGLEGTPVLVINGEYQHSPISYSSLATAIKLFKLRERQFMECPPVVIDPLKQYTARLHLAKGDIVIRLFPEYAPLAVNSFVFLVRQGWYDGVTFHSMVPGIGAQTGDPSGTGLGGPGYAFVNETASRLSFDTPGLVGMANAGPDSNGSQFFITLAPQPELSISHTLFGEVISGLDVVASLAPRNSLQNPNLPPGDVILSVTIDER